MSEEGFFGQRGLTDANDDENATAFIVRQALNQVRTSVPVKVIAVHGGGVGAPPTIDVQPLIKQIDGQGNATEHGIIYGIPTTRNQGGGGAIINDPVVGDVGHMIVSDRDMSSLKANNGEMSNPGSFRTHGLADGVYHGAILNPANPDQYVQFTATGMKMVDKSGNVFEMDGNSVTITTVTLVVSGDIRAGGAGGVSLLHHIHNGVTPGGGNSGQPVP